MQRATLATCLLVVAGCASVENTDPPELLRLGAVNLGLNANQPNVRERQDLYLSTKPGTEVSFLVDVTERFRHRVHQRDVYVEPGRFLCCARRRYGKRLPAPAQRLGVERSVRLRLR